MTYLRFIFYKPDTKLEDRPIEIDISKDKIIRILTKKLEELTAENERLRDEANSK